MYPRCITKVLEMSQVRLAVGMDTTCELKAVARLTHLLSPLPHKSHHELYYMNAILFFFYFCILSFKGWTSRVLECTSTIFYAELGIYHSIYSNCVGIESHLQRCYPANSDFSSASYWSTTFLSSSKKVIVTNGCHCAKRKAQKNVDEGCMIQPLSCS